KRDHRLPPGRRLRRGGRGLGAIPVRLRRGQVSGPFRRTAICAALVALGASAPGQTPAAAPASPAIGDTLERGFKDPPDSAKPRVWWHWLNGNVTKDGIHADLA